MLNRCKKDAETTIRLFVHVLAPHVKAVALGAYCLGAVAHYPVDGYSRQGSKCNHEMSIPALLDSVEWCTRSGCNLGRSVECAVKWQSSSAHLQSVCC